MAKHEVIIQENTGATKTEAPYLPRYVKKSDLTSVKLYRQVAEEAGLTETQVRAIFEGAFAEFEALEQEAAVRIHVDGLTVSLTITGSFASSDAAFDPLKNKLELAIYLDDDVKNALANVTPAIVTDETATIVRITGISDDAVPRPYEVIHGTHPFNVQALNNVTTDTGATAYFESANGTIFPATLVSTTSKQLSQYKSATLLEAGDYKFWIKSRGGDAEGPLQAKFRRVKYLKIIDPTPIYTSTLGGTKIYAGVTTAGDHLPTDDIHVTSADDVLVLTGDAKPTNPENPTTGIVSAYLTGCGEENIPLTPVYDTAAGTMTLKLGLAMFQIDPGTYENAKIKLVCYKDGQLDGLEIAKKVIKSE